MKVLAIPVLSALVGGVAAILVVVAVAPEAGDLVPTEPVSPATVEVLGFETGGSRAAPAPTPRERPAAPTPSTAPRFDDPPVAAERARRAVEVAFRRARADRPGLSREIAWRAEERMEALRAALGVTERQVDRVAAIVVSFGERSLAIRRRIVSLSAEAVERYRGWFRDGLRHESAPGGDLRGVLARIDPDLASAFAARDDADRAFVTALLELLTRSQAARLERHPELSRNPE